MNGALLAQDKNECVEIKLLSNSMGDGNRQWFAPVEHLIRKDTLAINLTIDKENQDDHGYFIVKSADWNWNCENDTGKITLDIVKKMIDVKNPMDIKFVSAVYRVDFTTEKQEITLKYENSPVIYFSHVKN